MLISPRYLLLLLMMIMSCLILIPSPGRAQSPLKTIDGEQALELVRQQCAFGPRVPGTPAHLECKNWMVKQLEALGMVPCEESFRTTLPLTGARVEAINVWGLPHADGPTSPALILSAHWDSRPISDNDPQGRRVPVLAANDGAAGVALALELARALRETKWKDHVVLAFWDAEDSGVQNNPASWALGSQHAAANPPEWIDRVALGINLDMIGGEELTLRPEGISLLALPTVITDLWRIGSDMAPDIFETRPYRQIYDDHLPWIESGVPFIDIIGLPYEHWHTAEDVPENVSAENMQKVGEVVHTYVRRGQWTRARHHFSPKAIYPLP